MLKRLKVCGFKSIEGIEVQFPQLTVLFGPNAAGKSNLLDAIQALSRVGTERTISDALSEPIRGYPIEAFAFPSGVIVMRSVRGVSLVTFTLRVAGLLAASLTNGRPSTSSILRPADAARAP